MGYSEEKSLERQYDMSRYRRIKKIRQILVGVSIISVGSSLVFGTVKQFGNAFQQPPADSTPEEVTSATSQLAAQARGYELVLQREPENQIALEGLANLRIAMKDWKGAIAPLEKLVELNGDRTEYQEQLEQVKQQIEQQK